MTFRLSYLTSRGLAEGILITLAVILYIGIPAECD